MNAANELQVVEFGMGGDVFAVPVAIVREILDYAPPSPVPNGPAYFLGLTDVRGQGVATLDLRRRLGFPPAEASLATRILILDLAQQGSALTLGVVVDRVLSVTSFETAAIETPPEIGVAWSSDYLLGVVRREGGFILLVDIAAIFTGTEAASLALSALVPTGT